MGSALQPGKISGRKVTKDRLWFYLQAASNWRDWGFGNEAVDLPGDRSGLGGAGLAESGFKTSADTSGKFAIMKR